MRHAGRIFQKLPVLRIGGKTQNWILMHCILLRTRPNGSDAEGHPLPGRRRNNNFYVGSYQYVYSVHPRLPKLTPWDLERQKCSLTCRSEDRKNRGMSSVGEVRKMYQVSTMYFDVIPRWEVDPRPGRRSRAPSAKTLAGVRCSIKSAQLLPRTPSKAQQKKRAIEGRPVDAPCKCAVQKSKYAKQQHHSSKTH